MTDLSLAPCMESEHDPPMPTPGEIFAIVVFSIIGFGAFRYGKRDGRWQPMVIGMVLMAFPYFVSSGLWLYLVGAALTVGLFIFRD